MTKYSSKIYISIIAENNDEIYFKERHSLLKLTEVFLQTLLLKTFRRHKIPHCIKTGIITLNHKCEKSVLKVTKFRNSHTKKEQKEK